MKKERKPFGRVNLSQQEYGKDRIVLEMNDQYYNMKEKIEPVKEIVDIAYNAMESLGIEPIVKPIRGGTDGSQLSYMGFRRLIFLPAAKTSMGNSNIFPSII